jgi:hypothetical protein
MKHAPVPYVAAYTDVFRSAIIFTKSAMLRNNQLMDNIRKVTALMDAVSGIPETLFSWDAEKEPAMRRKLEYFDSQYAHVETDFCLMKIYKKHVEGDDRLTHRVKVTIE